jgi:hypothetical protein
MFPEFHLDFQLSMSSFKTIDFFEDMYSARAPQVNAAALIGMGLL